MTSLDTKVVVIGGGVTGVAVLRDLALRGIDAVLVERSDLGTGTSGRWHGLLHSGGRYAVRDEESARECIEENLVLRRIAPHTIEDLGGLFVLLPQDDPAYAEQFVVGCKAAGIPVEELTPGEARKREPLLAERIEAAYAVPDGGIDSWALIRSMVADASSRGARVLTRHPVVGFERDGDRLAAVRVRDLAGGEDVVIGCEWVVNAAGAWAGQVGALAGVPIEMIPGKGVMVVMASRYVRGVVNACRKPADGDIVVPQHEVAILGTTSVQVEDPDDVTVDPAEVDRMIDMCAQMVPSLARGRVLRAFAGSRPLYKPPQQAGEDTQDTRAVSRTFTVLDHAERDGLANLFSIVGGKLTTCRQMAEKLVDRLGERMGVTVPCTTAEVPLPGADHGVHTLAGPLATVEREGAYGTLICECELVTAGQVRQAVADGVVELEDLRRRLRLGYGPCQAAFCAWRAAAAVCERQLDTQVRAAASPAAQGGSHDADPLAGLARFVQERWRGQLTTVWGDQARQALLNHAIYRGIFDLAADQPDEAAAWRTGGIGRQGDGQAEDSRSEGLEREASERDDPAAEVGRGLIGDPDRTSAGTEPG
ncbi:MAG TPA: anaerobic glycerol-3-phosphate dehydrogenase subunit GlpA [Actinomycetota bacterium]|nr:anaerobic glycerol-3-phosphate dehydrogenase subunit GlpA [Actinomycetota bacterium]